MDAPPAPQYELGGGRESIANSAALRLYACLRSRNAAALKDLRNLAILPLLPALAGARGAGREATDLQTDRHRPPGRRCGCWPTSPIPFPFYEIRQGANNGARAIGAKGCHRRRCTAS